MVGALSILGKFQQTAMGWSGVPLRKWIAFLREASFRAWFRNLTRAALREILSSDRNNDVPAGRYAGARSERAVDMRGRSLEFLARHHGLVLLYIVNGVAVIKQQIHNSVRVLDFILESRAMQFNEQLGPMIAKDLSGPP